MKKAIVGIGVIAAGAALALTGGPAKAGPKGDGEKKSSKGKKTPSGVDPAHISDRTVVALTKQDIAGIRDLVGEWKKAGDPLTAGALDFTIESAVRGEQQPEWPGDGSKGTPLLRAFGHRILILEGRPGKLLMWADDYAPITPVLAAAMKAKAEGIAPPSPEKGSTDDAIPDAALLQKIIAVMASGDPIAMRKLADELDSLGFDSQADDLRVAADKIESGRAKVPVPELPGPAPAVPAGPGEPGKPPAPKPPAPAQAPPGGSGRVVIVKRGEGPFQITQRLLGKANGARFKELVSENIPPKKKGKNGGFTSLNPGERLKVPASWPAHPEAIPDLGASAALPSPAEAKSRFVIVKKGEGPFQIALRLLGPSGPARWRELVDANVPPKTKNPATGGFKTLNPGERLRVPDSWPASDQIVFGEDIIGASLTPRQAQAGRVALNIYLRKMTPKELAAWQQAEGIEPSGAYGPATALVLCFRFGLVPPVPHVWGKEPTSKSKFASQMFAAARRDPARKDEFERVARAALGKVS